MFVARLLAALKTPPTHLGRLDDTMVLDVDLYRAALLHLVRQLSDDRVIDEATAAWTVGCIADGWVDEHLGDVRDGLLELGAVRDQGHLDRLLLAATQQILGCGPGTPTHGLFTLAPETGGTPPLTAADLLLLQTVTQTQQAATALHEPLGLRLLVRRYALELGLLRREGEVLGALRPTALGEALLALPTSHSLEFLLALEVLQSTGPMDRWRTPRLALSQMQLQPQFLVATTAQARLAVDPTGLFPWQRIRRLHLLGVCEPVEVAPRRGEPDETAAGRAAYPYRLSDLGAAAAARVLREPRTELGDLAEQLLHARAQAAVAPLLRVPQISALARPSLSTVPLHPPERRSGSADKAELPAAKSWESPPAEAYSLTIPSAVGAAPTPSTGEVCWQIAGPLATLPATTAGLTDSLAADTLLSSIGGTRPFWANGGAGFSDLDPAATSLLGATTGKPPGSGPAPDSGARQELDIGGLIQRAWAELHITGVHFALLGPAARLIGQRRALLQAWRELLRSAADAALQGMHSPPLITVELDLSPDAVQILVHDSGPPLSAEDAATIEHSYVELALLGRDADPLRGVAEPERLRTSTGSRRGLWLAQRTLTQQGALLALSTPQLGGTTVRVTLPLSPRPLRSAA